MGYLKDFGLRLCYVLLIYGIKYAIKIRTTAFELCSDQKPSVSHLKKFGYLAYVGVPKEKCKKFDMRG